MNKTTKCPNCSSLAQLNLNDGYSCFSCGNVFSAKGPGSDIPMEYFSEHDDFIPLELEPCVVTLSPFKGDDNPIFSALKGCPGCGASKNEFIFLKTVKNSAGTYIQTFCYSCRKHGRYNKNGELSF